jgi:hypothetical protein
MTRKTDIEELIASTGPSLDAAPHQRASARLKSRIYSRIVQEQAASGPLLSLSETKASGTALCVFEELVRIAPVGEDAKTKNWCRVCHARVVAERIEHAPIYWPHCPYAGFQNR